MFQCQAFHVHPFNSLTRGRLMLILEKKRLGEARGFPGVWATTYSCLSAMPKLIFFLGHHAVS